MRSFEDISGMRGVDCNMTAQEMAYYGVFCYSDVGIQYDIWWWFMMTCFSLLFLRSLYIIYIMLLKEKIIFSPQYLVVFACLINTIIRIIFFSTMYNGRTYDAIVGGIVLNSVLLKLGQCIMLSSFLIIVLVWKSIINATQKMQAMKNDKRNIIFTCIFVVLIFFIATPLAVLSNYYTWASTLGNVFLAFVVIALVLSGAIYANSIHKLINSTKSNTKQSALRNIEYTVIVSVILATICIVAVVLNTIGVFEIPSFRLWCWWFVIHACEIVFIYMLIDSASYKSRFAAKNKRNFDQSTISTK